jgi:hypothetical protein
MSACNCCDAFPINVVTLEGRQRGAQLSKCGTNEYDLYSFTDQWPDPVTNGPASGATLLSNKFFLTDVITVEVDGRAQNPEGQGTSTRTYEFNAETGECDVSVTSSGLPNDALGEPGDGGFLIINNYELSNEYTNAQLIENTRTQIPEEFIGEWESEGFTAAQYLEDLIVDGDPGASYSETQMQVRISHPPTASGYLRVWLYMRTSKLVDYGGNVYGEPINTELEIYEWDGEPTNAELGIDDEENRITSDVFAVPIEEVDLDFIEIDTEIEQGQVAGNKVEIVVWKYSLLEGYEPDDPIINEETFQLERPDPDCKSNGVPTLNADCPFEP